VELLCFISKERGVKANYVVTLCFHVTSRTGMNFEEKSQLMREHTLSDIGPLEAAQRTLTTSTVMSVSRPARCLFSGSSIPHMRVRIRCRNFHTSPNLFERRRPKFASVKASDMGLLTPQEKARENFQDYSSEEMAALQKKYTPAQIKAIKAGEAAIDPEDLDTRGVIRTDIGSLPYLDDFSQLRPVLDRAPVYEGPIDPNARLMTGRELEQAWERAYEQALKENPPLPLPASEDELYDLDYQKAANSRLAIMKADDRAEMFMGTNGPIPIEHTPNFLAPGLPRTFLEDEEDKVQVKKEDADPRDPDGQYNRLIKQTGLTLDQIMDCKAKILVRHRVVNQTRLGKIASIYCLAVAGNENGRLGIGEAKGQEIEETSSNARIAAIRNMQPIPRYEERTIFGEVEGKVSAAEVKLMSRPPGKLESLHPLLNIT